LTFAKFWWGAIKLKKYSGTGLSGVGLGVGLGLLASSSQQRTDTRSDFLNLLGPPTKDEAPSTEHQSTKLNWSIA
jgi:hypothetical protein